MLEQILAYTKQSNECLEWTRCLDSYGYPRMGVPGNCNVKVHRLVFELSTGINPKGSVVRHKCDNRKCVNPDHLELGTPTDNMIDRQNRGRTHNHMSDEEFERILQMRNSGVRSYTSIANELGISRRRVEYALIKRARK